MLTARSLAPAPPLDGHAVAWRRRVAAMAADEDVEARRPTTLRARHRAQTRRVIGDAARELFAADGYEATTVAAIAERAGVGLRTFYRYFPSKEHVAVDHLARFIEHGVEIIEARPDDEHPLDSIRGSLAELSTQGYERSLGLDAVLVEEIPAVAGVQHHLVMEAQDRLTTVFAARLGTADTSLEARCCAVVCTSAYQAAVRTWMRQVATGQDPSGVWDLAAQSVDLLGAGLRAEAPVL
jgi:AcrR family transcriptional regulator